MISDAEVDRAVENYEATLSYLNHKVPFKSIISIKHESMRAALATLNLAGVVGGDALELEAIVATLPGVTYMDPPDGGSPSLDEQFKRMVVDARRYRYIRNMAGKRPQDFEPVWDAAFASTYGDTHNFDINIDDQISALAKGNDHGN